MCVLKHEDSVRVLVIGRAGGVPQIGGGKYVIEESNGSALERCLLIGLYDSFNVKPSARSARRKCDPYYPSYCARGNAGL